MARPSRTASALRWKPMPAVTEEAARQAFEDDLGFNRGYPRALGIMASKAESARYDLERGASPRAVLEQVLVSIERLNAAADGAAADASAKSAAARAARAERAENRP